MRPFRTVSDPDSIESGKTSRAFVIAYLLCRVIRISAQCSVLSESVLSESVQRGKVAGFETEQLSTDY